MKDFEVGGFIKCINVGHNQDILTRGRLYEVISHNEYTVTIIDNEGRTDWFFKELFQYDVEFNRNKTINEILD